MTTVDDLGAYLVAGRGGQASDGREMSAAELVAVSAMQDSDLMPLG